MKKFEEYRGDWPTETFDEERVVVWTSCSFASQAGQKSQGALVVTQSASPTFWKCATQSVPAFNTAISELQMMVEGSLAAQNVGMLLKEMAKQDSKARKTHGRG